MDAPHCRRFFVCGRVQGVGFRYATAEKARELGITGDARNLPDGRVEVLACGAESALREFREWLEIGPSGAHVQDLKAEDAPCDQVPADFRIR
ncbi:MAG: acylphosphatase [Gammaproteobacteria bacterium]